MGEYCPTCLGHHTSSVGCESHSRHFWNIDISATASQCHPEARPGPSKMGGSPVVILLVLQMVQYYRGGQEAAPAEYLHSKCHQSSQYIWRQKQTVQSLGGRGCVEIRDSSLRGQFLSPVLVAL